MYILQRLFSIHLHRFDVNDLSTLVILPLTVFWLLPIKLELLMKFIRYIMQPEKLFLFCIKNKTRWISELFDKLAKRGETIESGAEVTKAAA